MPSVCLVDLVKLAASDGLLYVVVLVNRFVYGGRVLRMYGGLGFFERSSNNKTSCCSVHTMYYQAACRARPNWCAPYLRLDSRVTSALLFASAQPPPTTGGALS